MTEKDKQKWREEYTKPDPVVFKLPRLEVTVTSGDSTES